MTLVPLAIEEVEDFWALGLSIEAAYVPEAELARALVDGRVQTAYCASSMGTAETFWSRDYSPHRASVVVPPGQTAYETPHEDWADDRDIDTVLWKPWRAEQVLRLAANVPDAQVAIAIAECVRVLGALEARFARGHKLPPPMPDLKAALDVLMRRIERFKASTLDQEGLRFAIKRVLVAIAWRRPWAPVDVDAYWSR